MMAAEYLHLPNFRFENGAEFFDVPIAYKTWGKLSAKRDNVILVCHALTGNTAVDEWWPDLLGPGRALDTDQYFVVCANVIASPYGSLSPLSQNRASGKTYGANFPVATLRDTVALHKRLLEALEIRQVAFAIGGSMGGMQALEWAFHRDFVRALVPIAVGGRHSAWCIAWGEAQREAIRADPAWLDGRYAESEGPVRGLAVARMIAMISYRSHQSFSQRFGRESSAAEDPSQFSMESYIRYQGQKLVDRFDANCYMCLTESMDSHDIARGRGDYQDVLQSITQPALVVGIDSDLLYPLAEQREIADGMPNAELAVIEASHGHDSFLIELDALNRVVGDWRRRTIDAA
jgi:homoserine O-acetyltransferase